MLLRYQETLFFWSLTVVFFVRKLLIFVHRPFGNENYEMHGDGGRLAKLVRVLPSAQLAVYLEKAIL